MSRFVVRKNTLPYVHPWSVFDKQTGGVAGQYKTEKDAKAACVHFETQGITMEQAIEKIDAIEAAAHRMQKPDGDKTSQQTKRHSTKRRVELDK